ncbi:hypothetical protein ACFCX4_24705 [Kitasatospora sp. NPDC056327]|uniref:hypothetical protein n=1 Tax=Kitasatospora sp. NPDC056327 TaxID=3345785 RepID=UPI0035DABCE8
MAGIGEPVLVGDPLSPTDRGRPGRRSWQMPVLVRLPGVPPAGRAVVEGFEPYRPGEPFPPEPIERPGVDVFVGSVDGVVRE